LKAGEWFRRGRLLMVSPVHGNYRRCQAEIPLIVLSRFPRPALTSRPSGPETIPVNIIGIGPWHLGHGGRSYYIPIVHFFVVMISISSP